MTLMHAVGTASVDAPLILNGAPLPTENLTGVEIFDSGKWNGERYTDKQIDDLIANTNLLIAEGFVEPPMKIGHSDDQQFLEREGFPAAGWVTRVYKVGTKVVADIAKVPETIAALIKAGAYRKVSSEIWREYGEAPDGHTYGHVLKAVAFLGEEIPAVGSLSDIVRLYKERKKPMMNATAGPKADVVTMAVAPAAEPTTDDLAGALLSEFESHIGKIETTTKGKIGAPQMRAILREAHSKIRALMGGATRNEDDREAEQFAATHGDETKGGEPPWSEVDQDTLTVSAFAQGSPREFAHHWVSGGKQYLHLGGLRAALNAATGRASPEVVIHLQAHARAVGLETKHKAKGDHRMDPKTLAKALGLAEDASEQDILARVTENAENATKFAEVQREVETFKEKEATAAAETVVTQAIADKKIVPAQKAWATKFARKDPEAFKEFLGTAPARFATEPKGHEGTEPEGEGDARTTLNRLATEKARESKGTMTYGEALREVRASNPDLARQAAAAIAN